MATTDKGKRKERKDKRKLKKAIKKLGSKLGTSPSYRSSIPLDVSPNPSQMMETKGTIPPKFK